MTSLSQQEALSINSSQVLVSGVKIPSLGLGVYKNTGDTVVSACLAALESGYRHIDSAQMYANESEVAEAMEKSGLKRSDVFVSTYDCLWGAIITEAGE